LAEEKRSLEKRVEQMKEKLAHAELAGLEGEARILKGVKVLAKVVSGMDRQQMRTMIDSLRNKWESGVVVLASAEDSNVSIVSGVTKNLTSKVHAGKLVGAVAQAVGGKGGGRPDMAEGGGKDASALPGALAEVYVTVEGNL
jgi:alanyl-tRNA synthetase